LKNKIKSAARVDVSTLANPRNPRKSKLECDCDPNCDGWPRWYAVHTGAGDEKLACGELKRVGYHVFYPVVRFKRRAGNRIGEYERGYFSRYLFIAVNQGDDWGRAKRTPGCSCVVYFGGEVVEIPHMVMAELMSRVDHNGRVVEEYIEPVVFKEGDLVRLNENAGAWAGLFAIISRDVDKSGRIKAWIETFGRATEIEMTRASADHV